jgi:7-cyano-7-deazaguanine synthase
VTDRVIAIVSGGLDSTTMVYDALSNGVVPDLVSLDYGQRHCKELDFATANRHLLRHDIIDMSFMHGLLRESGSSLVGGSDVPEGHYAEANMKATVVPNRNMVMLSIAGAVAVARGARTVMTGVHAGDHFIYPDCRPEFVQFVAAALVKGNEGFANWWERVDGEGNAFAASISAPYLLSTKADIAFRALELGVRLHQTWSCYQGGDIHCGRCGTCVERLEAIDEAQQRFADQGIGQAPEDQTEYEDTEFWKTVTNEKVTDRMGEDA